MGVEHAMVWCQNKLKKTLEEHLGLEVKGTRSIDYSIQQDQADRDKGFLDDCT